MSGVALRVWTVGFMTLHPPQLVAHGAKEGGGMLVGWSFLFFVEIALFFPCVYGVGIDEMGGRCGSL